MDVALCSQLFAHCFQNIGVVRIVGGIFGFARVIGPLRRLRYRRGRICIFFLLAGGDKVHFALAHLSDRYAVAAPF